MGRSYRITLAILGGLVGTGMTCVGEASGWHGWFAVGEAYHTTPLAECLTRAPIIFAVWAVLLYLLAPFLAHRS